MFQSTRPRGRTRHRLKFGCCVYCLFQSTRPRGRTRLDFRRILSANNGFNPRVLAGGRDSFSGSFPPNISVSIHASSREDATHYLLVGIIGIVFQSTRPRGRTRHQEISHQNGHEVSIHASSREDATITHRSNRSATSFNPRVLAGGRDAIQLRDLSAARVSIHASSREDATIL